VDDPPPVTIVLEPYDPRWARVFDALARELRAALGDAALQVEHVGSTSVPGLAAKPIVDIDLVVTDSSDEAAYAGALDALGYRLMIREPQWYEHRVFRRDEPMVNLHVFSRDCEEVVRMIRFRDRLRTDPGDRKLYEATKRELAARPWPRVQDYADAKSEVVAAILERAPVAPS